MRLDCVMLFSDFENIANDVLSFSDCSQKYGQNYMYSFSQAVSLARRQEEGKSLVRSLANSFSHGKDFVKWIKRRVVVLVC